VTGSSSALGSSSSSSSSSVAKGVLPAASLPLLANHLRQAGLLPKWVHWLLQQLPQRPELFDRAFLRLFHKVRACWCIAIYATRYAEYCYPRERGVQGYMHFVAFWMLLLLRCVVLCLFAVLSRGGILSIGHVLCWGCTCRRSWGPAMVTSCKQACAVIAVAVSTQQNPLSP
jgi:hypothetical protein